MTWRQPREPEMRDWSSSGKPTFSATSRNAQDVDRVVEERMRERWRPWKPKCPYLGRLLEGVETVGSITEEASGSRTGGGRVKRMQHWLEV